MSQKYHVYELQLAFKYERERVDRRDMAKVVRALRVWAKPAKHRRYSISIVMVSSEPTAQLVDRVAATLDMIDVIDDYTVTRVLEAEGKHGSMCPFHTVVQQAWLEVAKRSNPQHRRQRRPRNSGVKNRVKNLDSGTSI